jgi:uncharacterized NAD-dependent epimerase/dehydratase family protein
MPEGNAIVYCEGSFGSLNGKTAHGLVRYTKRYRVLSVIDSCHAGKDAGKMLDGKSRGIPIFGSLDNAYGASLKSDRAATHLVIGLAPDGGRLNEQDWTNIRRAVELGLNIDSGLHDFISDNSELVALAGERNACIRDIRKPPPRSELHFFSGKIDQVTSLKVAVLGTDSAVGKRTTAREAVEALRKAGISAEMIGTGQTAWMQGVRFGIVLDSIVNDFLTGEIEHVVWSAWNEVHPEIIVIEGQGSLLNPAYPGGYELIAAARPDAIILQCAPARKFYDGFPQYPMDPLPRQIQAIHVISGKPVVALTVNHEGLPRNRVAAVCASIADSTGLPTLDVLIDGAGNLVDTLAPLLEKRRMTSAV